MKEIKIEKLTLNCGTGTDPAKLERAYKLLEIITGEKPVKTRTQKRIPSFGLRPGLQIGCKVTIRKNNKELLKRLLESIGNKLKEKQFADGYFAFGIKEYIEIPDMNYNREIGIMGLEVCVTLMRAGKRITERRLKKSRIPMRHKITKEETMEFMKKNFNIELI